MKDMPILQKLKTEDFALPEKAPNDIIILPERVAADGTGLYVDSAIDLMKQLREQGTDVAYMHDATQRKWIGRHGIPDPVSVIALGIASSAGWDALKMMFGMLKPKSRVRGKVTRCVQTAKGTAWEWFEFEGTAEDVSKAINKLPPTKFPR